MTTLTDDEIVDIMLREGYLSREDYDEALRQAGLGQTSALGHLLENGVLNSDLVGQAIAEYHKVPYVDLEKKELPADQLFRIPEKIARSLRVVVFDETEDTITVASSDPKNPELPRNLFWIFGKKKMRLVYATDEGLKKVFTRYKMDLSRRFSEIIGAESKVAPKMVSEILKDALLVGASDVHLEPRGKKAIVRFRIDGVLTEIGDVALLHYHNMVNL